mmetsp:Transcript_14441/g.43937  ORF Transcript_14441/g.43937 Transcript_14441/m.43937 type:complete len:206 (-) Transcript_14441:49-666(-)
MVDANVHHPRAQARGGLGLGGHEVVVELLVGLVWRAGVLAHPVVLGLHPEVILVKVDERLQELLGRSHHLLGRVPRNVQLLEVGALGREHVGHGGCHLKHRRRRAAERLELGERVLVEKVESLLGGAERGLGSGEVAFRLRLELGHLALDFRHLVLLHLGLLRLLGSDVGLLAYLDDELVGLGSLGLDHLGLLLKLDLHVGHLLG